MQNGTGFCWSLTAQLLKPKSQSHGAPSDLPRAKMAWSQTETTFQDITCMSCVSFCTKRFVHVLDAVGSSLQAKLVDALLAGTGAMARQRQSLHWC